MKFQLVFLVFVSIVTISYANTNKIICHFSTEGAYSTQGKGQLNIENVDPHLCTHIIYAYVSIDPEIGIRVMNKNWKMSRIEEFEKFLALKKINPAVKLMISIGGWNEGSFMFSYIFNDPSLRANFINNVLEFLKKFKFDGIDIDWQYPGERGGNAKDRGAFIELIKEMRPKFDDNNFILSASVSVLKSHHDTAYDIKNMSRYLDFINLKTFDYHGGNDYFVGENAPLYASKSDINIQLNVDASVRRWIASGASSEKLILGLPAYGHSFTLADSKINHVGAISSGLGAPGTYTYELGKPTYLEICENLQHTKWTKSWESDQQVPYAFNGNQWIGYDDTQSVSIKTVYAHDLHLGGVMIWSLHMDDARNVCKSGKFPLLRAINAIFKSNSFA